MPRTKSIKITTFVPADVESRVRTMLRECGRGNPQVDGHVAEITIKRIKSPIGPSIE